MSSIAEQILTAAVAALTNKTPAGDRVYRSRSLALARDEAPAIVVRPANEDSNVFSAGVDDNVLTMLVEVYVRGDPFDQIADPIVTAAHAFLHRDPGLRSLVTQIRKKEKTWDGQEADDTAGFVTTKYELRYLTAANDLTVAV